MNEHSSSEHARPSPVPRRLPSFPALAAFEAVARHQSFAKAAAELNVTQSAISHRITSLERHFEARFFVRSNRSVTLTAQGTFFLGAVIEALATLNAACSRLSVQRKVVRISVGPAFARSWLVGRLGDFYRTNPDVDLEVNATKLAETGKLACLRSGEADVSIRYGSRGDWPGFEAIELTRTHVFPVCSPAYKATLGTRGGPKALRGATLLRSPREPWAPWFKASGLDWEEPQHGPQFSDAALMLDAAARGQGVALARSALVEHDLEAGRLVRVFDTDIRSDHSYHAIYSRGVAERAEVAAFLRWITRHAHGEAVAAR